MTVSGGKRELDYTPYTRSMKEINARLRASAAYVTGAISYHQVESALLQTRMAIETLAMSSLVNSQGALTEVALAIERLDFNGAFKAVLRANPQFWPQPMQVKPARPPAVEGLVPIVGEFLTVDEYREKWGRISALLHARNPLSAERDLQMGAALAQSVNAKLSKLLSVHCVTLADSNQMLVCKMNVNGEVRVTLFERLGPIGA